MKYTILIAMLFIGCKAKPFHPELPEKDTVFMSVGEPYTENKPDTVFIHDTVYVKVQKVRDVYIDQR